MLLLLFLMHRVELKDLLEKVGLVDSKVVPNAPCGVESQVDFY